MARNRLKVSTPAAAGIVTNDKLKGRIRNHHVGISRAMTPFALYLTSISGTLRAPPRRRRISCKSSFWRPDLLAARYRALPESERCVFEKRAYEHKQLTADARERLRTKTTGAPATTRTSGKTSAAAELPAGTPTDALCTKTADTLLPTEALGDRYVWVDEHGVHDTFVVDQSPNGCLGSGSFGQVRRATSGTTGTRAAVKICTSSDDAECIGALEREVWVSHFARHPSVLAVWALAVEHGGHRRALIMPEALCSVWAWLQRLRTSAAAESPNPELWHAHVRARCAHHVGNAVGHLHSLQIAHLDVKPDNALVMCTADGLQPRTHFVLCDFGSCHSMRAGGWLRAGRLGACFINTYVYRPISLQGYSGLVTIKPSYDVWAFGCVLLELYAEHCQHSKCGERLRLFSRVTESAPPGVWESTMTSRMHKHCHPGVAVAVRQALPLPKAKPSVVRIADVLSLLPAQPAMRST